VSVGLAQKMAAAKEAAKPTQKSATHGLRVAEPDDVFERQADRMAEEAIAGTRPSWSVAGVSLGPPDGHKCACGSHQCAECSRRASLRRKASILGASAMREAPSVVHDVLRAPGRPLATELRAYFEPRFGFDFGKVRVHDDAKAAESADAVAARAYTVGEELVFAAGAYAPDTAEGRRLIAHELAHVVQQSGGAFDLRLQRQPHKDPDPNQASACLLKANLADDGDSTEIYPPIPIPGRHTQADYVIWGKPATGDTPQSLHDRAVTAFVSNAYGALSTETRGRALRVLLTSQSIPFGAIDQGCAYPIYLSTPLMDLLRRTTGVEVRHEKEAAEKKANKEKAAKEKARKDAGHQAENREYKAGLPAPPDTAQQKKEGGLSPAELSGSEFTGTDDKTANTSALPAEIKGPELQPTHGTGTYTMQLEYSWAGSDLLSQTVEAMNWVNYHWERFDITNMVMKGLSDKARERMKQKKADSDATVGKMAAAGRRAEYTYEDLKEETENSIEDLSHPIESSTTGSATEIATKAIANYENLTLLPASAIVRAGGWALGALADMLGGTDQEREIPWPDKPGYYFIRCIAQPDPQGKHGEQRRAASVAVKTVELRDIKLLARNALLAPQAEIEEKKLELEIARKKQPPDPKELEKLENDLKRLETKAGGPAIDVIRDALAAKIKERETAASDYRKSKLDDEIRALQDQLDLATKRAAGMTDVVRPVASLVSKITGDTYPLLLQLGKVDAKTQDFAFLLSDVTSRDGRPYRGEGTTEQEAAGNAVREFAGHNDYGDGTIAIAMPAPMPKGYDFQFPKPYIQNSKRDTEIAKARINDLIEILVILGLFIPGVGEAAMVLGAAMAAAHILQRWEDGTLRFDESLVSDLIAVLSSVFAGAAVIGELRVVKTGESFLLKSAKAVAEAAEVGNKTLMFGGLIWGNLETLNDIMADNQAELEGKITHAEARRNRAMKLASAVQSGALVFGSMKGKAAEEESGAPAREENMPPEQITAPPAEEGKQAAQTEAKTGPGEPAQAAPPAEPAPPAEQGKQAAPAEQAKPAPPVEQGGAEPAGKTEEPASDTHDPDDPVHAAGQDRQTVDPKTEKPVARYRTADGLHDVFVLEDGRLIRCSLECGELRAHYDEFLQSALKDPDENRRKLGEDLDKRLKTAETGAKSSDPKERQAAAKDAAELEPKLRALAAKDLAAETGLAEPVLQKLSETFTPSEIRRLSKALGAKRLARFAEKTVVRAELAHGLGLASVDPPVADAMMRLVENAFGKVSDRQLANAISDLGQLVTRVPGYITGDFLDAYGDAVAKGDVGGANKLLKASEEQFREAQRADRKAALAEKLRPLEEQQTAQEEQLRKVRKADSELQAKIATETAAMKAAADEELKATTPEAKQAARAKAIEARNRKEALEEQHSRTPTPSEEAKNVERTKQAIADLRLRMDPESRAPLPCFAADTPVWTSDGMRRIDEIRAGDRVYTFDFGSQRLVERIVTQTHRNLTDHFFRIQAGGCAIQATGLHRFWIEGLNRWVSAAELQPGMRMHARENEELAVDGIAREESAAVQLSWNLSVDGNPNYFVGPGLLAHNDYGFDTGLGGDITIYRGVNPNYPDKVYVGKTTDTAVGGKSRGVRARQAEHRAYALKQLEDRSKLSQDDIDFYEFMSGVELTPLVTGLSTKEQGQYLEQKNIEMEGLEFGEENVLNRRNEITSPERMAKIEKAIENDPKVLTAGFCRKG